MQTDTAYPPESAPVATASPHHDDLPPGLPANVARAIRLLDKLDQQTEAVRRCTEAVRASVDAVLGRSRLGSQISLGRAKARVVVVSSAGIGCEQAGRKAVPRLPRC